MGSVSGHRGMSDTGLQGGVPPRPQPTATRDRQHLKRPPEQDEASKRRLGRYAVHPGQIPWAGWKRVLMRAGEGVISDRVTLAAAGCAFYAVLAMFPTISMLIALYGLVFDPHSVESQLAMLRDILPAATLSLISDRVHDLVSKPPTTLTFSFVFSLLLTLWSSSAGTKSILSALNIAYDEIETRSFVRYQITALAMTLCAILGAGLAVAFIVALPPILTYVPQQLGMTALADELAVWIRLGSFLLMLAFVVAALSVLYRFGPNRRPARWNWVSPGSLLATAALAARLARVLVLRGPHRELRRDLRAARRDRRHDDVVLRDGVRGAGRRRAERGTGTANGGGQHRRRHPAYRRTRCLCGGPRRT